MTRRVLPVVSSGSTVAADTALHAPDQPDGAGQLLVGARPQILLDRRGAGVDGMIARVRDAVGSYPYPNGYRPWPGPNSNTFLAHIARQVPDLAIQPNAVGKDFLPGGRVVAPAPSGSGFQVSLYGLISILFVAREGLEVNLLGLSLGVDPVRPALKLPALGRLGMAGL
jgi:hypothetical protein